MGRFAPRPKVGPIRQRAPLAHPQSIRYEEQPMHHKRCKFQVKIQQTFEWPQLVGSEEECSLRTNNPFFLAGFIIFSRRGSDGSGPNLLT